MAIVHLFLIIHKPEGDNNWSEDLATSLKKISGIENVMIIGQNQGKDAQLNLDIETSQVNVESIEKIIMNAGGKIVSTDVHFPHIITGISDAYGASAISIPLTEEITKIDGVLGVSISSSGIVKVELAPDVIQKSSIIQQALNVILERQAHKS